MKILVAPDSFKGTLSAAEICGIAREALKRRDPLAEVVEIPIADGGEGTVACFHRVLPGSVLRSYPVRDLYFRPVTATVCFDGTTAILETASVAGLDPLRPDVADASTVGVGELIRHVLDDGAKTVILGLGGSGTNDGGIGMATALGARFTDADGTPVSPTGKGLLSVSHADFSGLDARIRTCRFLAACDVKNPLYGINGAAFVFAGQKGADAREIRELDAGLRRLAEVVFRDLGAEMNRADGSGAAGGLGAAVRCFLGGELMPGIEWMLKTVRFEQRVRDADAVLTGEGCVDRQTLEGKVPFGVAALAAKYGKPVICLCGKRGDGWEELLNHGVSRVVCINPEGTDWETAQSRCRENLFDTVSSLAF